MFSKLFKKKSFVTEVVSQRQPSKLQTCKVFVKDLCTYARTKKPSALKSYKTAIHQTDKSTPLTASSKPCSNTSNRNEEPSVPIDTTSDYDPTDSDSLNSFDFINKDEVYDSEYVFVPNAGKGEYENVLGSGKHGFENSFTSIKIDESDEDFNLFYDALENPDTKFLAKTSILFPTVSAPSLLPVNKLWSRSYGYNITSPPSVPTKRVPLADKVWLYFYESTFVPLLSLPTQEISPVKSVEPKYSSSEKKEIADFILNLNSAPKELPSFSKKQPPSTMEIYSKDLQKTVKVAWYPKDDRRTKCTKTL